MQWTGFYSNLKKCLYRTEISINIVKYISHLNFNINFKCKAMYVMVLAQFQLFGKICHFQLVRLGII